MTAARAREQERVLARLPRGDRETRIRLRVFEGKVFVDVREFGYEVGRVFPTQRGVTFRGEELERVIAALEVARIELANSGDKHDQEHDRDELDQRDPREGDAI